MSCHVKGKTECPVGLYILFSVSRVSDIGIHTLRITDFICCVVVEWMLSVLGQHISGSPSVYFPSYVDDDSYVTEVFGPSTGHIKHVSSTFVINRPGLESISYSAENLRVRNSKAGWMTVTAGNCVETVAVTFPDVVLLHHLKFMNWGAATYQVSVRRCQLNVAFANDVVESNVVEVESEYTRDKSEGLKLSNEEQQWVCLDVTPQPTAVPHAQHWKVVIDKEERDRYGPVDALRLDISGGSNTAFYGLNVFGFMLHEEIDSV